MTLKEHGDGGGDGDGVFPGESLGIFCHKIIFTFL